MTMNARAMRIVDAVVIGASAGGIDALSALLPALRVGTAAAVLVVLHTPRQRPSLLADILKHKCALPVREAVDKEPVEAGTVYLAPPDYHLLVDAGPCIALSIDEPIHYSRPSIDPLFESAADVYRQRLLGIILSGANDDGASGLAAVHRAGGMTWVQDPVTAPSPTMIRAALALTPSATVLTLAQMCKQLSALRRADALYTH